MADPVEIERKYLLSGCPALPAHAERVRIEQGYLPSDAPEEGRVRRTTAPDGSEVCFHTIKRGAGLRRVEIERVIDAPEFERLWPLTAGRRIGKVRHRVRAADGLVWEIDVFDDLDVVLAEVELPSEDAASPIPDWLQPCVVREVTDEATYRNYQLALRARDQI